MLFRYIKFEDGIIEKEVIFSAECIENVYDYIIQHPEQFELPDYFTSESEITVYITDKDSLLLYWSEKSYLSDGLIQCKIEEIIADIEL